MGNTRWDGTAARKRSLRECSRLGFAQPPPHLGTPDDDPLRPALDVAQRALVANVAVNVSFGMPEARAQRWLRTHGLWSATTPGERLHIERGLTGPAAGPYPGQCGVEAICALLWALQRLDRLDFGTYVPDGAAAELPDLREDEGPARFLSKVALRDAAEIYDAADLALCLSWGARDASLHGRPPPGPVRPYVVWERRRALEWLCGGEWDDPELDT